MSDLDQMRDAASAARAAEVARNDTRRDRPAVRRPFIRRWGLWVAIALSLFGFAMILAAGFVFEASPAGAADRPQQLATFGAMGIFVGGGMFGLWGLDRFRR